MAACFRPVATALLHQPPLKNFAVHHPSTLSQGPPWPISNHVGPHDILFVDVFSSNIAQVALVRLIPVSTDESSQPFLTKGRACP